MSRIGPRTPSSPTLRGRLSVTDLLWLANTRHGPGGHWHARAHAGDPDHDHLVAADVAWTYLHDHGVPVPPDRPDEIALARLRVLRDTVQGLVEGHGVSEPAQRILAGASFGLDASGAIVARPPDVTGVGRHRDEGGPAWSAFVEDLLVPLIELAQAPERLRRCDNPLCRLVFVDASRNHGRRWCDDAGCSNRARVARARRRATAA